MNWTVSLEDDTISQAFELVISQSVPGASGRQLPLQLIVRPLAPPLPPPPPAPSVQPEPEPAVTLPSDSDNSGTSDGEGGDAADTPATAEATPEAAEPSGAPAEQAADTDAESPEAGAADKPEAAPAPEPDPPAQPQKPEPPRRLAPLVVAQSAVSARDLADLARGLRAVAAYELNDFRAEPPGADFTVHARREVLIPNVHVRITIDGNAYLPGPADLRGHMEVTFGFWTSVAMLRAFADSLVRAVKAGTDRGGRRRGRQGGGSNLPAMMESHEARRPAPVVDTLDELAERELYWEDLDDPLLDETARKREEDAWEKLNADWIASFEEREKRRRKRSRATVAATGDSASGADDADGGDNDDDDDTPGLDDVLEVSPLDLTDSSGAHPAVDGNGAALADDDDDADETHDADEDADETQEAEIPSLDVIDPAPDAPDTAADTPPVDDEGGDDAADSDSPRPDTT